MCLQISTTKTCAIHKKFAIHFSFLVRQKLFWRKFRKSQRMKKRLLFSTNVSSRFLLKKQREVLGSFFNRSLFTCVQWFVAAERFLFGKRDWFFGVDLLCSCSRLVKWSKIGVIQQVSIKTRQNTENIRFLNNEFFESQERLCWKYFKNFI